MMGACRRWIDDITSPATRMIAAVLPDILPASDVIRVLRIDDPTAGQRQSCARRTSPVCLGSKTTPRVDADPGVRPAAPGESAAQPAQRDKPLCATTRSRSVACRCARAREVLQRELRPGRLALLISARSPRDRSVRRAIIGAQRVEIASGRIASKRGRRWRPGDGARAGAWLVPRSMRGRRPSSASLRRWRRAFLLRRRASNS